MNTKPSNRYTAVLSALLASASLNAASVPPPEQLLPSDSLAVLTVPDFSKVVESRKYSPMCLLWDDAALRPFRDKLVAKFTKEVLEPVERQLGVKLSDYADLVQGQFTLAVTQNGWQGDTNPLPGLVLIIDARDKSDQLAKNLADVRKKISDGGQTLKIEKIRDVEFATLPFEPPQGPKLQLSFGQTGSLLLAGSNPKDLEKVLVRLAGSGGQPLAEVPAFDKSYQSLLRGAQSYGWVNFSPLYDVLVKVAGAAGSRGSSEGPQPEKILAALGLGGLKTLGFATHVTPDGGSADLMLTVPEAQRRGLFKLIATEAKDAAPPASVPADAITFNRWRLDGQKFWATLTATLSDIAGPAVQNFFIAPINDAGKQKDPNFDLQKSLIGNLGDDIVSYNKAPRGTTLEALTTQPSLTLIGSPNAEQLLQAFRTLVRAIASNPMFAGAGSLEFKEREFQGRKIYSLPLPNTGGPGGSERSLMFAAGGSYLAISADAAILEEHLRSGDSKPKPLSEAPGLSDAAQKVGGMATGLFGYQNDQENMRVLYELARSNQDFLGKMVAASPLAQKLPENQREGVFKEWLDFSLLPSFERIAKYFFISVFAGSTTPDGYLLKVYTPLPAGLK